MPSSEENNKTLEFIVKSSKTGIDYPNISVAQCIAQAIEQRDVSFVALVNPTNRATLTYDELHSQAQQFSSALVHYGVTKNDFVLFYAENSFEYVVAMLGTIYLGLTFCSAPPSSGPFEISEHVKDSNATVFVFGGDKIETVGKTLSDPKYVDTMIKLRIVVQLGEQNPLIDHSILADKVANSFEQMINIGAGKVLKSIPYFPFVDLDNEHFFICYTSGTSGTPKGAIHTNKSFVAAFVNTFSLALSKSNNNEPNIMWYPMGHMSGTFILLYSLYAGDKIILLVGNDLDPLLAAAEKYKLKRLPLPANHTTAFANTDYHKKYDLSSLAVGTHGGMKTPAKLVKKIREKYSVLTVELYGTTEFVGGIGDRNWADVFTGKFESGNLGTVAPNTELKIVDLESGKTLQANQAGEICFRGPSCFVGYLNNRQATESTLINGWYHSGDVGYYDQNCCLYITDRIKEMIKYKLYSVTPAEIEDFLHLHDAVAAVCVVGVPHITDGNLIRAYVQLMEGKKVTKQKLIDYVKDNMGSQKRLRAGVRFVTSIPRTLIGKVDRQYFKRLVQNELLTEPVP